MCGRGRWTSVMLLYNQHSCVGGSSSLGKSFVLGRHWLLRLLSHRWGYKRDGTQFMSGKTWLIHSEINGVHSSSTSSQQPVQLLVLLSKKSLNIWTHLHMYVRGICGTRWWSSRQQSKWDLPSGTSDQLFIKSNSSEKQDWRLQIGSSIKCRQPF